MNNRPILLDIHTPEGVDIDRLKGMLVPLGRVVDVLYLKGGMTREDALNSIEFKTLPKSQRTPDKVDEFIERLSLSRSYPITYYQVNKDIPLLTIYNVATSKTDGNSIDFQVLHLLIDILGMIPPTSLTSLVEVISALRDIDTSNYDQWKVEASSLIETIDPGSLSRHYLNRVRETLNTHDGDAEDLLEDDDEKSLGGMSVRVPVICTLDPLDSMHHTALDGVIDVVTITEQEMVEAIESTDGDVTRSALAFIRETAESLVRN